MYNMALRKFVKLCALTQAAMIAASCTPTAPVLILSWLVLVVVGIACCCPTSTCSNDDDKPVGFASGALLSLVLPSLPPCQRAAWVLGSPRQYLLKKSCLSTRRLCSNQATGQSTLHSALDAMECWSH